MTGCAAEAGVTLIEMLAALTVSALIGVAGFALLDGVTTRDAQLDGRNAGIARLDRAFHLLALDTGAAQRATWQSDKQLHLETRDYTAVWGADESGLWRTLGEGPEPGLRQHVLDAPARLSAHAETPRALLLHLEAEGLYRIFAVGTPLAP